MTQTTELLVHTHLSLNRLFEAFYVAALYFDTQRNKAVIRPYFDSFDQVSQLFKRPVPAF